jgi:polysaccharide biosynthesis transport protein
MTNGSFVLLYCKVTTVKNNVNPSAPAGASWQENFLSKLQRYRKLLLRSGWIVIVTAGLGLLTAALYLRNTPPAYLSAGRMMVSGQIKIPEGGAYAEEANNFYGTQIELMRSGAVRERAMASIAFRHPELSAMSFDLAVSQLPNASMFDLRVTSASAEYSKAMLDAIMNSYIDLKKEMRSQTSEKTLSAITDQLKALDVELRNGEQALLEFQKQNNIVFLKEQGNTAGAYLVELNSDLSKLRTEYDLLQMLDVDQNMERSKTAGAARDTKKDGGDQPDPYSVGGPESDYMRARQQVQLLKVRLEGLLRYLRPAHPKIVKLNEEIAQHEHLINIFKKQSVEQINNRREGIRLQIQNLQNVIKEWEVKALDLSKRMAEYEQLKSKVERAKSLYERLSASVQGIDLSRTVSQEMVTVMEAASPAISVKPVPKVLALGGVAGIALGIAILALMNRLDTRVHSLAEVEEVFGERVVGHVPKVRPRKGSPKPQMLVSKDDRHAFAESFKNIRSSLLFPSSDTEISKVLLVTSGVPNEGKSTVAQNLAITMAFSGARTILVDGDLRRGVIHKEFGIANTPGLAEVLQGTVPLTEAIQTTSVDNLFLLTRGCPPAQPGELYLQRQTDGMLAELREQFDFVILDSAPILAADDTTSLAPKVDSIVCVVRLGFTAARLTLRALDLLRQRDVNVLGVVLNCADSAGPDYYYYQYKEYYASEPAQA